MFWFPGRIVHGGRHSRVHQYRAQKLGISPAAKGRQGSEAVPAGYVLATPAQPPLLERANPSHRGSIFSDQKIKPAPWCAGVLTRSGTAPANGRQSQGDGDPDLEARELNFKAGCCASCAHAGDVPCGEGGWRAWGANGLSGRQRSETQRSPGITARGTRLPSPLESLEPWPIGRLIFGSENLFSDWPHSGAVYSRRAPIQQLDRIRLVVIQRSFPNSIPKVPSNALRLRPQPQGVRVQSFWPCEPLGPSSGTY